MNGSLQIFSPAKPVIFAFHGYPQLIRRLIYRRPNQGEDMPVIRDWRWEGAISGNSQKEAGMSAA